MFANRYQTPGSILMPGIIFYFPQSGKAELSYYRPSVGDSQKKQKNKKTFFIFFCEFHFVQVMFIQTYKKTYTDFLFVILKI